MYIVVRKDLKPGAMLAQSLHALMEFREAHPELSLKWFKESNYIVCLEISSEEELLKLVEKAKNKDIKYSIFREPDFDNALTAAVFEPTNKSKKLCSNLKLAFNNG